MSDILTTEMRDIPINHVRVSYHCSDLRITVTSLGPFIDVRAADDGEAVICDEDFGVNVHLLGCQYVTAQFCPVTQ